LTTYSSFQQDAGDGFEYKSGEYLLTTYSAQRQRTSDANNEFVVIVSVAKEEGRLKRKHRKLVVLLLLPQGKQLRAEGTDGEPVTILL